MTTRAKRILHMDRFNTILTTAMQNGGRRISLLRSEWDISGDCYNPYPTEISGRPSAPQGERTIIVGPGRERPGVLLLHTRCRKCERCLKARMRRWAGAVRREHAASQRTWFGTLTLSPDEQFKAQMRATAKLAAQGVDFDALTEAEQFLARHRAIGPDLTKYVDRVRKESGAKLRYLLVAEVHKSGLPHYHMLYHEAPLGGVVTHRTLSTQWKLGFERWRLANPQKTQDNPTYLCKYLSKSLLARVRASQGYGVTTSDLHTYVIASLKGRREEIEMNRNEEM